MNPDKIDSPCKEHSDLLELWDLVDALMSTETMREAGRQYLPQRTMEHKEDYKARLKTATLLPAFKETIENYVGRVFDKPLQFSEDVPPWIIDEVADDVDMQGRSFEVFASAAFSLALRRGIAWVLTDSPRVEGELTVAEQKAQKVRPYAFLIDPRRVIGYRYIDGRLKQLRVKFWKTVEDGKYGVKTVDQIRVYEPGLVTLHEKDSSGEWIQVDEATLPGDTIPAMPIYTDRVNQLSSKPPLLELAYLNAKHWSMQSSVDNLVETAQIPILAAVGVDDDTDIKVGAQSAVSLPEGGDLKYVEHTGKAIEAGRKSLVDLEHAMRVAGGSLLQRDVPFNETAAKVKEEAAKTNSKLAAITVDFQDALGQLLDMIAAWRGADEGGSVMLQPNLDPVKTDKDSMTAIKDMNLNAVVSRQTWFNEGKRRGLIDETIEWEDEQVRIAEEGID